MTGFLNRLFGSKPKDEAPASPEVKPPKVKPAKPAREKAPAYYLNADDAQSYGNVEYMRTAKKTRRTFPKTLDGKEIEFEQEISSMNPSNRNLGTQTLKVSLGGSIATSASSSNSNSSASIPNTGTAQRRKADSSMDVFRKMAKDIRK